MISLGHQSGFFVHSKIHQYLFVKVQITLVVDIFSYSRIYHKQSVKPKILH